MASLGQAAHRLRPDAVALLILYHWGSISALDGKVVSVHPWASLPVRATDIARSTPS